MVNNLSNRLYGELAWLWPLWGNPKEYAPYCKNVTRMIRKYARREVYTMLNIGCGGGKNIFNLKNSFTVSGLDISPAMLALAEELNPECRFYQGDMLNFSLPEQFDSILVDDSIAYMTSEAELQAVFKSSYEHLRPGGVMIVGPDHTKESFIQNSSAVTCADITSKPEHIDVVFVENNYDPDPNDNVYEALILYLIRENGKLRIEKDLHQLGLFSLGTWKLLLGNSGFVIFEELYEENGTTFNEFVCLKPE